MSRAPSIASYVIVIITALRGSMVDGRARSQVIATEELKPGKFTLHQVEVTFNFLVAKVKLIFGRGRIPKEIPPQKQAQVSEVVHRELARYEAKIPATPPSLPNILPVVPSISRPSKRRTVSARKVQRARKPVSAGRSKYKAPEIIDFVPVARTNNGPAVLLPTNVFADTVRQLASHHRQKAVKRGDVVEALIAAYVEQEATKAAYASPRDEERDWY